MSFHIFLTDDAVRDLEEPHKYITEYDGPEKADYVLDRIEAAMDGLSEFPERGSYPKELLSLGIREYREVLFKPYRLIYRVIGEAVYIYLIADGRRDMQSLLQRRLIRV
jgi:toxin ParE1/3/4